VKSICYTRIIIIIISCVIFLHFYNELKFHILSRDWKMLELSPGIKILTRQKVDIARLCCQVNHR